MPKNSARKRRNLPQQDAKATIPLRNDLDGNRFRLTDSFRNGHIEVISDPETSGELRSRPGIDQVKAGIEVRRWDLILAEDSGRLFRDPAACAELVGTADDEGIRVILPGDDIDTASDNWLDRLLDAQQHHARSNYYTRRRIKRSHDGLWEMGAQIGHVAPGYTRRAT